MQNSRSQLWKFTVALMAAVWITTVWVTIQAQGFKVQRNQMIAYNIGSNLAIGGIGRAINKPDNETFWEALAIGAWRGASGGAVIYSGKRMTRLISTQKSLCYGGTARLVHTTGASIVENAASGNGYIDEWNFEFGPAYIRVNTKTGAVNPRVQPFGAYGFMQSLTVARLDAGASLKMLTPIFQWPGNSFVNGRHTFGSLKYRPFTFKNYRPTVPHELMHAMQFREYLSVNRFTNKLDAKARNIDLYNKATKYIHLDIRASRLLKAMDRINYDPTQDPATSNNYYYSRLWFEYEAEHFAEYEFIPRTK